MKGSVCNEPTVPSVAWTEQSCCCCCCSTNSNSSVMMSLHVHGSLVNSKYETFYMVAIHLHSIRSMCALVLAISRAHSFRFPANGKIAGTSCIYHTVGLTGVHGRNIDIEYRHGSDVQWKREREEVKEKTARQNRLRTEKKTVFLYTTVL